MTKKLKFNLMEAQ